MNDQEFQRHIMRDVAAIQEAMEIHTKRHCEIDDLLVRATEVVPFATKALDRYRREVPVLRVVTIILSAEFLWRWLP